MTTSGPGGGGRRVALDGLRGVAALVVVVHHTLMVSPAWLDAYTGDPHGTAQRLFTDTPLRLVWAGGVAVTVFFVLSGYVLTVSVRHVSWSAYYPRRLVRLYLPVFGAVALALALLLAFPRSADAGRSTWFDAQAVPVTAGSLFRTVTLWMPDRLVSPLWSLHWEVAFSVLLPVYLLATRWLRRFPLSVAVGAVVVAVTAGALLGNDWVGCLSVFWIGVLMADREVELLARVADWRRGRWALLGAAGIALMSIHGSPMVAAGAGVAVFMTVACRPVATVLSHPFPLWLGRLSYSLYLVHIVVVLALASVVPLPAPLLLVVTVPGSLALAAVFHRWVELPAQRLAYRTSAAASAVQSGPQARLAVAAPEG